MVLAIEPMITQGSYGTRVLGNDWTVVTDDGLLAEMCIRDRGNMAKTSLKVKQTRKPKYSTRAYTRCKICGRPHSVLKKYGICRICFRELAYKGEIPGVRKASW